MKSINSRAIKDHIRKKDFKQINENMKHKFMSLE